MFKVLKKLVRYPRLTLGYPRIPVDTRRMTGCPEIDPAACVFCGECAARCPSRAIVMDKERREIGINLDECLYCTLCEDVCPSGAARMTHRIEIAARNRDELRFRPLVIRDVELPEISSEALAGQVMERADRIFGRSLQIREVDAGSCNGCDYEINALNNPFNDIERLGIHFVASPRHADMLLVTGCATRNMQLALVKTWNATPDPKLVVAIGACACSGGIFQDLYATADGIDRIVPVDVYVPGCPPRPQAIMYGILKALDRVK